MMSEIDDNLSKALAANGDFDAAKAGRLRAEVVDGFGKRLKKVERIAWAYLIFCSGLLVFAGYGFLGSTSTKALMSYGLLVLVSFEIQTLIKLWYWVINNKISVLKEIKLLQLQLAGGASVGPEEIGRVESVGGDIGQLVKKERFAWFMLIVLVCGLIGFLATSWAWGREAWMIKTDVTLAADGSGRSLAQFSRKRHRGFKPTRSFNYYDRGELLENRWVDGQGREMPFTVSKEGEHDRYTIRFVDPVWPGEQFDYSRIVRRAGVAEKQGDVWTYSSDSFYSGKGNHYVDTVVLPKGAEIVSVDPEPDERLIVGGAPGVRFKAEDVNKKVYKIEYRLPEEGSTTRPGGG